MFFPLGFWGAVGWLYLKLGLVIIPTMPLKKLASLEGSCPFMRLILSRLLYTITPNHVSSLFAIKSHRHYCFHYHEHLNLINNKDSSEKL